MWLSSTVLRPANSERTRRLATISTKNPTFGAEDRVIPVAQAHGLPGKVGVHIFAGCGHMPQIEERAAVLQILKECAAAAN